MPYVTYSIWVDAPAEVRLQRGLDRDGPAALEQWQAWMAEEDEYRSRERPDERADLVIRGDRDLWASFTSELGEQGAKASFGLRGVSSHCRLTDAVMPRSSR